MNTTDLIKLGAILLKHSSEAGNILSKAEAAGHALITKGDEKIDPACDLLNAFKPLEGDLISGGFMVAHHDEASLKAAFTAAGLGSIWDRLIALASSPAGAAILPIVLKLLGL